MQNSEKIWAESATENTPQFICPISQNNSKKALTSVAREIGIAWTMDAWSQIFCAIGGMGRMNFGLFGVLLDVLHNLSQKKTQCESLVHDTDAEIGP